MDIIARTFGTVAELYSRLKREAAKVGETERDRTSLGNDVTIDGDTFEVVEEFVYLGSLLTADNNVSREIRKRIISGSRAYYGCLHGCRYHQTLNVKRLAEISANEH